jgi:hypothetical protein
MTNDPKKYDKKFLRFESEFVGSFIMNLFYLETDPDVKEGLREEIQRRRDIAKELYKPH